MNSDEVDYILSQDNGAAYLSLYLMLCTKTINTGGVLATKLGDKEIPYTVQKIARDCKYFAVDTINVALVLFKQLGLIEERADGILQIANFGSMVGSETKDAERMRRNRAQQAASNALEMPVDNSRTTCEQCSNNVRQEIEKEKEKDTSYRRLNNYSSARDAREETTTTNPTIEEVRAFAKANNFVSDPDIFYHHNNDNGWKNVTSWHASFFRWEKMEKERATVGTTNGNTQPKPSQAEAIAASKDYKRGEMRATLNADPTYQRLAATYNKASLAIAKAELDGRAITDDLMDAFDKALGAMNDRVRQLGFAPIVQLDNSPRTRTHA